MPVVYVGLGANLGDRRAALEAATARICVLGPVRRSSWYRTAPVGMPGAPEFLNGVVELVTALLPAELLERFLEFEREMGRRREEKKEDVGRQMSDGGCATAEGSEECAGHGPKASRTVDIDMLLYGSETVRGPGLCVPHPRMHERAFVLVPMCELAPETRLPGDGRTMRELLAGVGTRGVRLEIHRN